LEPNFKVGNFDGIWVIFKPSSMPQALSFFKQSEIKIHQFCMGKSDALLLFLFALV